MGNLLKNIVKSGITMLVIGLVLGLAAPVLGEALGNAGLIGEGVVSAAKSTSAIWLGAFFGTFGALSAAVSPAINYVFGDRPEKNGIVKELTKDHLKDTVVENPVIVLATEKELEKPCAKKFREAVIHERAAAPHDRSVT